MTSVQIRGLEPLLKKVKSLEDLEVVKAGLKAAGTHVKGRIAKYPPRRHGARQEFVSDRQRRFFFAALNSGQIEVPYVRGGMNSEDLGDRWTVTERNRGLTIVVGNNASYAPFVQDAEFQTKMHRDTGWKTTEEVAEQEGDEVVARVKKEVDRLLEK